jgi:hypothetical protein
MEEWSHIAYRLGESLGRNLNYIMKEIHWWAEVVYFTKPKELESCDKGLLWFPQQRGISYPVLCQMKPIKWKLFVLIWKLQVV